jgi:inhibitor of cysteine peptidase
MKREFLTVLLLAILFVAVRCAAVEVQVNESHNGSQRELNRGQVLVIALASNPTTGFRWQVAEIDPAVLRQSGDAAYESSDKTGLLVGAGGTETFRFETLGAGKTTLKLIYRRSWEKDAPPAKTFSVTIAVR